MASTVNARGCSSVVERSLCMWKARGSIPRISRFWLWSILTTITIRPDENWWYQRDMAKHLVYDDLVKLFRLVKYHYIVTRLHIRCIVGLLWPWRNLSDCMQMGYTPLEEVNQAIYAWSYRQLEHENYGQLFAKTLLKELVVSSWYGGHRHPVDEHLVYQDLVRHCHFVEFHYIVTLLSDYS